MYYIQYIKYIKKWVEYIKLSLLTHILCGEYYGLAKYFTSVQYLRREHIRVEFLPSWSSCLSACYKKSRAVATCVRRRRSARVGRGTARRGGGGATRRAFTRGPTRRSATGASVAVAATSSMPMWETRGKAEMLSQSYCKSPPTSPPCPGQRERVPPKGRCAAARPPIRGSSSHHTFSNSRNCIRFIWNGVGNFLRSVRGIIHFLSNSTQTVLIFLLRLFGEKGFDWC